MKTKLVPFDIEKAKQGAKVVTRDGRNVRIGFYDLKNKEYPVGAVETNNGEGIIYFSKKGKYNPFEGESNLDLFIEEEVKTRRMTCRELADWLCQCPEECREFKYEGGGDYVYSSYDYTINQANTQVWGKLIRRNGGEWQEPLIEE